MELIKNLISVHGQFVCGNPHIINQFISAFERIFASAETLARLNELFSIIYDINGNMVSYIDSEGGQYICILCLSKQDDNKLPCFKCSLPQDVAFLKIMITKIHCLFCRAIEAPFRLDGSNKTLRFDELISALAVSPDAILSSDNLAPITAQTFKLDRSYPRLENNPFFIAVNRHYQAHNTKKCKKIMLRMCLVSIYCLFKELIVLLKVHFGVLCSEHFLSDMDNILIIIKNLCTKRSLTNDSGFKVASLLELAGGYYPIIQNTLVLASVVYSRDGMTNYLVKCIKNYRANVVTILCPNEKNNIKIYEEDIAKISGFLEIVPIDLANLFWVTPKNHFELTGGLKKNVLGLTLKIFGSLREYLNRHWDIALLANENDNKSWDHCRKRRKVE